MVAYLTTRQVADRLGVETWQVRRLYTTGDLPEPGRIGVYRVIPESDVPQIEEILRRRGWLTEATAC